MEATTTYDLSRALSLLPAIFARCLDRPGGRYDLEHPFADGGFVYATDCRLAVRVPIPEGWDLPNFGRVPRGMDATFAGSFRPDPVPLPEVVIEPCQRCKGAGRLDVRPCKECNGTGVVDHECDCAYCTEDYDDCQECGGTGKLGPGVCEACDGTGRGNDRKPIPVGGVFLQARFVHLLREFDATAFLSVDHRSTSPVRFVAGEVEGRVMTCAGPDED